MSTLASGELAEAGADLPRAEAFRRLADRHLDSSYRLARAILGDPAEAEDATHDAFVQAWRKWSTLRDPALFEHWFRRILVNICRNRLRRRHRWSVSDLSPLLPAPPADAYRQTDERDAVGRALRQLSADHRIAVALRFYLDLTVEEMARYLDVRPGTVKSRLHHAVRRLHHLLDEADTKEALG